MIAFVGARCMAVKKAHCHACGYYVRCALVLLRRTEKEPAEDLRLCSGCAHQAWDAAKKSRR